VKYPVPAAQVADDIERLVTTLVSTGR